MIDLKSLYWLAPLLISQLLSSLYPMDKDWYQEITKDIPTPPSYVFAVVWPILYILIGIVLARSENKGAKKILLTNLALNYVWIIAFNRFKDIKLGLLLIVFMIATLGFYFKTEYSPQLSILLIPYFIWLLYAGYLNARIFIENI